MDITCYTYNDTTGVLTKLGIVDDFVSFNFSRDYSNIGEWTLVLNGNSLNTQRIKGTQIISVSNGVAGIVEKPIENIDENGEYTVTYTGYELKYISALRIITPESGQAYQSYVNVSPEYVIDQLIKKHIINPQDVEELDIIGNDRKVNSIIADYEEGSESIVFNGRFDNVAEAIMTVAQTYSVGWYADIQDDIIVWHIYRGIDRRKSQSTNSRMIVSYDLDSFGASSISNVNLLPNVALVAGQGEGIDRDIALVGSSTGLSRNEVYIDARDIEDCDLLPARGLEKLAEFGDPLTYEATFSNQFINLYRDPYELGDIGTIEDDRLDSGEVDFRLTVITEVYENSNLRLDATFGYDKQDLQSAIKRSTGKTQSLINSEGVLSTSAIIDLIYPVGCVIWNKNLIDPQALYGGTWTRITDTFIYAATDSGTYVSGQTGGGKTVSLEKTNLPSIQLNVGYQGGNNLALNTGGSSYGLLWGSNGLGGEIKTEYMGNGTPLEKMPPWKARYCWERTA